ncbi:MAG TPA: hydroxymethylglutaryl-CoA synthase, partial [Gammaproteobacteria bacterium]|nr:hydroxymethylglutaryl-CoA synthase [Gammaproteobacteria bacterium]
MIKVGIDAIAFYTPHYYLDLRVLAKARGVDVNKYHTGLGQEKMAVIPPDEDVVTMAADAASRVLQDVNLNDIDLLLFATESAIDQSKAAGIFVHRLLNLPARCRVVELKQACYSATAGLQMALPMLREDPNKKILLIASDVARYGLESTGESSQGGGAVAMVLSQNPRILAIEPESGFHTEDVMDFWRPNYREEAIVDGKYSCDLYLKLVQKTWEQYTDLSGRTFSDHARFCYHVPVPRLVEKAHQCLAKFNGLPKLTSLELSAQLGSSLQYGRVIGNCYTAALYLSLISLLENTLEDLAHQRIGFYSYGSGCIAEFFSGVVQKDYQDRLKKNDHQKMLENREALSEEEYTAFYNF